MALTQAQWYRKLRGWVPTWVFESERLQDAHFEALAKILETLQELVEDQRDQTFIDFADAPVLDLHGDERTTARLEDEPDGSYRERIRNLSNKVNKPDLKTIIDALLLIGEALIIEDFANGVFLDREAFLNRGELILLSDIYNSFTVIIDMQEPQPFSYLDREYFINRDAYAIRLESSAAFFNAIVKAIDDNKALGTLYRVVERLGT